MRKALRVYNEIHAAGRKLVERRREVHAADERAASRSMGAGKQLGDTRLENLSGILQLATEHGVIPANPARSVRKVPAERKPPKWPLAPAELEAVIAAFSGQDWSSPAFVDT